MMYSLISVVSVLLLGVVSCDQEPPKIPDNITRIILHILESDDFSQAVTPIVEDNDDTDKTDRERRSIRHGYHSPYVVGNYPYSDPFYTPSTRTGNINNGVLGTGGAINTGYLGQGPYGAYTNNGAVTNTLGGPINNYGTVSGLNNGPVTNFISNFYPGGWYSRSGEITRDYYRQGSYANALSYFRVLPLQQVSPLVNTGYPGYTGLYTTGRNSYSVNVCRNCYGGTSGIGVRSNLEPYNFLERRFLFVPEFNPGVYRTTGCVRNCNVGL
ncbi:hypothetical protein LOTGIDRAFT_154515 [Lottia gigantea]|uniref:Uncharacterized protein n=1 Tax=Lottia gigantea TaxID=225164 RepID=V4A165_LOTGI|nr:hypothetical protein LOTGIDRAFT_154515 [Lottia gigantea]ESO87031.1 hypothetical protein LOTGIDRAFT_154515 [Lottia gigantea]